MHLNSIPTIKFTCSIGAYMYTVTYRDSSGNKLYRNYKNRELFQVHKIADNYGKKHGLSWVSIVKIH